MKGDELKEQLHSAKMAQSDESQKSSVEYYKQKFLEISKELDSISMALVVERNEKNNLNKKIEELEAQLYSKKTAQSNEEILIIEDNLQEKKKENHCLICNIFREIKNKYFQHFVKQIQNDNI